MDCTKGRYRTPPLSEYPPPRRFPQLVPPPELPGPARAIAAVHLTTLGRRTPAGIAVARAEAERVLGAARSAGGAGGEHLTALRSTWRTLQEALVVSAGPVVTYYLTSAH